MKIIGTANLKIDSKSGDVITTIDLESGEIIVNPHDNNLLEGSFNDVFNKKISLTEFRGVIKDGEVWLETFPNLFVKHFNRGSNILDGYSLRSFEFIEKFNGVKLKLKPYNSKIRLNFKPVKSDESFTEFHFVKVNLPQRFDFEYEDSQACAVLDQNGHAVIKVGKKLSHDRISEFCDIFNISSCLAFGAFSSIREIFNPDTLTLNLSGYTFRKSPHRMIENDDFEILVNSVIKTFKSIDKQELSLIKNASYYLEGGYKQTVYIEFRLISLFTAIEILDDSKTLDKNIIKEEFKLKSVYDAALMISIRNKLIHNGMSVNDAIQSARNDNKENDIEKSDIESLFDTYTNKQQLAFYYYMLDLVTKYLQEMFNYKASFKPNLQTLDKQQ